MRGFIVLCLSAVAIAAPQGYNYPSGGVQQAGGFAGNFGGSNFGASGVSAVSGGAGVSSGFLQGAQAGGQQGFYAGHSAAGSVGGHHQQQQQQQHVQQHQQAVISKRFYIHSAPEDAEEDYKEKHITIGVPKKNYNVVFIKAPAKSNKKTSIKISPAVNEEKTVIYVLSKKTDASDVHAEVLEHAAPTAKPEVFFIKYKTAEEAAHAQQQIQAQYDALGGSSQVTDEGVAPVTSVIGSLGGDVGADVGAGGVVAGGFGGSGAVSGGSFSGGAVSGGSFSGGAVSGGAVGGGNAYLPPNFS